MDLKQILEDFNTCKKNFSSAAKVLKEIFNLEQNRILNLPKLRKSKGSPIALLSITQLVMLTS